jgi:hypothetical protein
MAQRRVPLPGPSWDENIEPETYGLRYSRISVEDPDPVGSGSGIIVPAPDLTILRKSVQFERISLGNLFYKYF